MLFLIEIPLLLLLMPKNITGLFVSLLLYFSICFSFRKYMKRENISISFKIKKPLIVIPIAIISGFYLWQYMMESIVLSRVLDSLPISKRLFSFGVAFILACLSVISQSVLLNLPILDSFSKRKRNINLNQINSHNEITNKINKYDIIFCTLIAVVIAIVCFDSFPFNMGQQNYDQSVFIYVGKMMHQGKIPYLDLFDHKGIILYFIQYIGLAMSISGTYSGIWLIELLNIFAFILIIYKIGSIFINEKTVCYLTVICVVLICGSKVYGGGNLTEEYALPWIAYALYIFVKFFYTNCYKKWEIVLLGIGCAVVAFLRVNMIAIWIIFIPLTAIALIFQKRIKEIFSCVLYFFIGFAAVCIPILVYTLITGSLSYMINYYILFNMEYSANQGSVINILLSALYFCGLFIPWAYSFIISAGLRFNDCRRMRQIHLINFSGFAVSMLFSVMSGRPYLHYSLIWLPFLTIPIMNLLEIMYLAARKIIVNKKHRKQPQTATVVAICLILGIFVVSNMPAFVSEPDAITEYLLENTAPDDNVLLIDNPTHYLESSRFTENKFFYQDPPINISDQIYNEFLDEVKNKPSDIILFSGKKSNRIKISDNTAKFITLLDESAESGVYKYEEFDNFYVYTLSE